MLGGDSVRKGIEQEVKKILTEQGPMTVFELAEALGYKTREVAFGRRSAGAFKIRELEDKGLVEYRDGKWYWIRR